MKAKVAFFLKNMITKQTYFSEKSLVLTYGTYINEHMNINLILFIICPAPDIQYILIISDV